MTATEQPPTLMEMMFNDVSYQFTSEDDLNSFLIKMHRKGYILIRATGTGYISRKMIGFVIDYNGRYGQGLIVHKPRFDVTGYHDVIYIVKPTAMIQSESSTF